MWNNTVKSFAEVLHWCLLRSPCDCIGRACISTAHGLCSPSCSNSLGTFPQLVMVGIWDWPHQLQVLVAIAAALWHRSGSSRPAVPVWWWLQAWPHGCGYKASATSPEAKNMSPCSPAQQRGQNHLHVKRKDLLISLGQGVREVIPIWIAWETWQQVL